VGARGLGFGGAHQGGIMEGDGHGRRNG
jgi:hypothetical protein